MLQNKYFHPLLIDKNDKPDNKKDKFATVHNELTMRVPWTGFYSSKFWMNSTGLTEVIKPSQSLIFHERVEAHHEIPRSCMNHQNQKQISRALVIV